jgi:hypothetical protein
MDYAQAKRAYRRELTEIQTCRSSYYLCAASLSARTFKVPARLKSNALAMLLFRESITDRPSLMGYVSSWRKGYAPYHMLEA